MTKKGINRASADVGLIMIVYNLKRIMNLVKVEELNQVIRDLIQLIGNKKRAIKLVLTIISLINVKRSTSQLFLIRIQITIQNSIFTNQLSSF
jgi:hypothetical protein